MYCLDPCFQSFIIAFLFQVGKDFFGENYIQNFKDNGVSTGKNTKNYNFQNNRPCLKYKKVAVLISKLS